MACRIFCGKTRKIHFLVYFYTVIVSIFFLNRFQPHIINIFLTFCIKCWLWYKLGLPSTESITTIKNYHFSNFLDILVQTERSSCLKKKKKKNKIFFTLKSALKVGRLIRCAINICTAPTFEISARFIADLSSTVESWNRFMGEPRG